jgi:hypothetical protein
MVPDRQQQLKRVLDRVQQLPIVPAATVEQLRGVQDDNAWWQKHARHLPTRTSPSTHGGLVDLAREPVRPRPWMLAVLPVLSAVVAAVIATGATLYVIRDTSSRVEEAVWRKAPGGTAGDRVRTPLAGRTEVPSDPSPRAEPKGAAEISGPGIAATNNSLSRPREGAVAEDPDWQQLSFRAPQSAAFAASTAPETHAPGAQGGVNNQAQGSTSKTGKEGTSPRHKRGSALRAFARHTKPAHTAGPELPLRASGVRVGDVLAGGL